MANDYKKQQQQQQKQKQKQTNKSVIFLQVRTDQPFLLFIPWN